MSFRDIETKRAYMREWERNWRIKHPIKARRKGRAQYKKNRIKISAHRRKVSWERRLTVLCYFGNGKTECVCCGESHPRLVTLDHPNGGGYKERSELKKFGDQFIQMLFLKLSSIPKDRYQVLCFNCNFGRQWNKGVCPHKDYSQYTGASTQDEQNVEADRIIQMLGDDAWAQMTDWEKKFVSSLISYDGPITGKQLFKLRDIKDRYL